jgi:hypothetical protein
MLIQSLLRLKSRHALVRDTYRKNMKRFREFTVFCEQRATAVSPDQKPLLLNCFKLWDLLMDQRAIRFEYLLETRSLDCAIFKSLDEIDERLDKDWDVTEDQMDVSTPANSMSAPRILLCFIIAVTLGILAGCTHLGNRIVSPQDSRYPVRNLASKRMVTIAGAVAPALDLTLTANYETSAAADCWVSAIYSAGEFEGSPQPLRIEVPMPVTRTANRFSASFTSDAFLPGKCNWHFQSVAMQITKGMLTTGPTSIVQALGLWTRTENKGINSSDAPLILPCRLHRDIGYSCLPPFDVKSSQILIDTTTSISATVLDDERP